jgi:hypothetical protein
MAPQLGSDAAGKGLRGIKAMSSSWLGMESPVSDTWLLGIGLQDESTNTFYGPDFS